MHWKRWKQLLIFVSSARGGEAAVCRAGKSMSSLSSVAHRLKSEFSIIVGHFPTHVQSYSFLEGSFRSIATDFPLRPFWLSLLVFLILSSRGLKLAPLSHWLTNGSCRANDLSFFSPFHGLMFKLVKAILARILILNASKNKEIAKKNYNPLLNFLPRLALSPP